MGHHSQVSVGATGVGAAGMAGARGTQAAVESLPITFFFLLFFLLLASCQSDSEVTGDKSPERSLLTASMVRLSGMENAKQLKLHS